MSKLIKFKEANLAKLEKKWVQLHGELKSEYYPETPRNFVGASGDIGFTHFVASEFVNHNNQSGEYVNV